MEATAVKTGIKKAQESIITSTPILTVEYWNRLRTIEDSTKKLRTEVNNRFDNIEKLIKNIKL